MPKEITHWTLAEKAFCKLKQDSPLKRILGSNKSLFLCGAVILDSPFYVRWGRDALRIREGSEKIHDTAGNPFACFRPLLEPPAAFPPEPLIAFLAGITTHVFSDAAFHPFVCYYSGSTRTDLQKLRRRAQSRHHTLESYLDVYFAARGPFPVKTLFSAFCKTLEIPRRTFIEGLSRLFALQDPLQAEKALTFHAAFQALFHRRALTQMLRAVNRVFSQRFDWVLSSFYPLERLCPQALFHRPIPCRNPVTGDFSDLFIPALEDKALHGIESAFNLIEEHLHSGKAARGFARLEGPNLYTGLTGRRQADMRYFDSTCNLMDIIGG